MLGMLQTICAPVDEANLISTPFIPDRSQLASVLLFGHDPKLLQTRTWIFQRDGCSVHSVSSQHDFRTDFLRHHPDLIVLCQTLSADECESAAFFAEEHAPGTRCILLYTRETSWSLPREHVLLNSNDGPRTLVDTVRRVLEERPRPVQG